MSLYIEIENGQPKNHPAFEENLMQAFQHIPPHWEAFKRVDPPAVGIYEVLDETPVYEKVGNFWSDVWTVRPMTDAEKTAKQQDVITAFRSRENSENWAAWTLDEATCMMVPPIPRPAPDQAKLDQGISTVWCGADANWKDTPVCPGANYKFDFIAWQWVPVVN
jgi:hypothetical protein